MSRPFDRDSTELGRVLWEQGWTATEFSQAAGIHPRTLTDLLAGRRPLSGRFLVAACDVLDCDAADLVT